jgi:hypothetical protein
MSTCYILPRGTQINRQQVLAKFATYLSDEDMKDTEITLENAESVGINAGGSYCWVSFNNDLVGCVSTYGSGNDDAVEHFEQTFGTRLISEHDDDFSYHDFPVDVRDPNVKPIAEKDGWEVFEDDGWCYLYNRPNNSFYTHVQCEREEMNIDNMIADADE